MRVIGRRTLVDLFWAIVFIAMAGIVMLVVPVVARSDEPACRLLDFYSDWCGPCQAMRPSVDAIASAGYTVERVNIDENPSRAKQYGVTRIPCFVALVDGCEVDRLVGAASFQQLEAMVKRAAQSDPRSTGGIRAEVRTRSAPNARPAPAWRYERATEYRSAVVRIFCQCGGNGADLAGGTRSIGSGTLVKWNGRLVVLTARHVIKDATSIVVELCTRKRHSAKVVKFDAVWDCAVLELNGEPQGVEAAEVELGSDAMQHEGDRLESCGYGPDGKLACNSGLFLGYRRSAATPGGPDDWLVISGHARGGDSGGPVFNRRGRLVGVLWGTDGKEVVCVQAGRLHVLLDAAVPCSPLAETAPNSTIQPRSLEAIVQRTPTPAKQSEGDACGCQPGIGRAQPECLERFFSGRRQPAPNVVVQPDPEVRRALENIDAKVGVLIEQRPPAQTDDAKQTEPSPLVAGVCMLAAVAAGFVVYFATQKGR